MGPAKLPLVRTNITCRKLFMYTVCLFMRLFGHAQFILVDQLDIHYKLSTKKLRTNKLHVLGC